MLPTLIARPPLLATFVLGLRRSAGAFVATELVLAPGEPLALYVDVGERRIPLRVRVVARRAAASERLPAGVFVVPLRGDDPALGELTALIATEGPELGESPIVTIQGGDVTAIRELTRVAMGKRGQLTLPTRGGLGTIVSVLLRRPGAPSAQISLRLIGLVLRDGTRAHVVEAATSKDRETLAAALTVSRRPEQAA